MFIPRNILPRLEQELDKKEATVITGMRRVGKTTLLNHLFEQVISKNKAIFDLENPLHRRIFEEKDYNAVWNNLAQYDISSKEKAYLFIDEIQNLPEISSVVKYLFDHFDIKFILTGSSSYYLKNLFPESLSGRKIVFEIYPLTFSEFLRFKGKDKEFVPSYKEKIQKKNKINYEQYHAYYKEYIEFGGFPSVVLEESQERKTILLEEIFTSYFEKDAKSLADFKDMAKLRNLILLLIPRIGQRLEIAKLAASLSLSRETVYNYLYFLEQTYFIALLPKFAGNIDRQAAGGKKLFICDSGIANVLGKISMGQLFEQSIFQNLRTTHNLHYYSREGKSEIDFIVDEKVALEVKLTASLQDIEYLRRRVQSLKIENSYIVSLEFNEDQNVIPAADL
jgi:predicted AAA+ superfamily ATPase